MEKKICHELEKALKKKPFFDVVGGCGVNTGGEDAYCMTATGVWFKFCPFCGKKIKSKYDGLHWAWWEE